MASKGAKKSTAGRVRGTFTSRRQGRSDASFCIVAIGASAGGFDALIELLHRLPADSGLAFIILQHLSPSPRSLSAELFSRHTQMPVAEARDRTLVEANHVYTAPADQDVKIKLGRLRLSPPIEAHGRRLPVDHLFRSLGSDQREKAIGIILSGTGSDGALGLKEIVGQGGIVLVQTPETAQYDGMPRSAMATGLVGHVLPIAKMPRVLLSYARHAYVRGTGRAPRVGKTIDPIAKILQILQSGQRQSFAGYKKSMLVRRMERRMGLLDIDTLDDYARRVRRDSQEAGALRKDLLIGVTEFFRDRTAWGALDKLVLRPLIASKKAGEPIRAWVAGTATGEEAYTLAVLLLARLRLSRKSCPVQIFGTDANPGALSYARAGRYPLGIRDQIGPELLKHFFQSVQDNGHYQVNAAVRESVIFGEHDLLADPPFSRLDLVSCRNVLIYLEPAVQARILMLCHFALRADGYLFLGSAETVGAQEKLFKSVDRKWHIYQRVGTTPRERFEWPVGTLKPHSSPRLPGTLAASGKARSVSPSVSASDGRKAPAEQRRLRQALRDTQEDLQLAVNQLKSSNEDLRASHEETMSINEELQSMNEELESSKEELQSVNEELNTVNTQLQSKITELEVANSDLRNLLASNEVATICLDRTFRIKWFTPAAHRLFNLLPSDIGRPITDLALTTIDSTLIENAASVLRTEEPRSHELEHKGIYFRRIVPYWTDNRHIGGVVITFADISEAKRAALAEIEAKAKANERLEARVRERTEELERLARELALAEVRERQSIARDLHDGLGQELNAASIKLDALRSAGSSRVLDEIAVLLEGVVREMRSLTAQLNPPVLEQLGLVPALEWLAEQMRKSYALEVVLEDDAAPKPLDSVTASILFRAVRELLINVARHAKVNLARVATTRDGDQLTVTVLDQGGGFSAGSKAARSMGLGLATLRERIAYIGGSFRITSEHDRGTTAILRAPLNPS
jgi:chemotaxis methyl-accepting protein methylase/signal transduction histidine kinase